jgi:hypothetical protein
LAVIQPTGDIQLYLVFCVAQAMPYDDRGALLMVLALIRRNLRDLRSRCPFRRASALEWFEDGSARYFCALAGVDIGRLFERVEGILDRRK